MHPLKLKSSILPVVTELNDFYEIIFLKQLQRMFTVFGMPLMSISKTKILIKSVATLFMN